MQLRDYQAEAIAAAREELRSKRATLIVLPTGCHAVGQPILRADGRIVAVEEVEVGDQLLGPDGQPRTVLQLARGRQEMAEVRPTKGEPFVVNLDHVLSLVQTPTNREPEYPSEARGGRVIDVTVREWLTWSKWKRRVHKLFRGPATFRCSCVECAAGLPTDPYLLGVLLGDGGLSGKHGAMFYVRDDEIVAAVRDIAEGRGLYVSEVSGLPATACPAYRIAAGRYPGPGGNPLLDALRSVGLYPSLSGSKFVPHVFKAASRADRLELLAGLMDTDGSASRGGYDFISKSPQLAADVAFLARSVGLAAYVSVAEKYSQHGGGGIYHRVSISGHCNVVPCRVPRKQHAERRQKKDVLRTGMRIALTGDEQDYYGFTVDGDGRYLLGDFTVTHNSGKTVVFSEIARLAIAKGGRVLVLAHRTELLDQATAKLEAVAPDLQVEREQASSRARLAPVVVASVQTLHRPKRLARWDRDAFDLVIVDEAHHAAAASYQRILDHFETAKILGFTATPDRADGQGLAGTFDTIAYSKSMLDLVRAGYLAPIRGKVVSVDGFDVSGVKVVRGDLQDKGLVEALDEPGVLDSIAKALLEYSENRSTLVFVPGVAIAHDLAELLEGSEGSGGAVAIDGKTCRDERRVRFAQFSRGTKRFLVNVGVATEGTDLPRCSCVAVVRPTMSRSLFVQMVGRGTRLFEGKPDCLVLNFAPQNCRHKLIVPVDAMLGREVDELTAQAIRELAELTPEASIDELFEKAEPIAAERRRRVHSIKARLEAWDPYGLLPIEEPPPRLANVQSARRDDAEAYCVYSGVPEELLAKMTDAQVLEVEKSLRRRRRAGLCSLKQARQLAKRGLNPNVSMEDAGVAMAALAQERWRSTPAWLRNDPRFRLSEDDAA